MKSIKSGTTVLILVVMEIFRKDREKSALESSESVLILVVMEIFRKILVPPGGENNSGLNPCCNGNLSKETYLLHFSFPFYCLMYILASVNHL